MQPVGQPLPFVDIQPSQDGHYRFSLNPACQGLFDKIKHKHISVLCIAGPQRTGKSFLANRILRQMKAFAIGATTQPCTLGIWVWSEPVELDSNRVMVVMDTEGLYSVQRDVKVDTRLFCLSILLSSMFVYNQLGHIDENSLEQLSLVLHLNEHLSLRPGQPLSTQEIQQMTPHLVWVLRDFSLDLQGRTPNEYLKQVLAPQSDQSKNAVRTKISQYFLRKDCLPMVRPLGEEGLLAHVESQQWSSLRPQFRESVMQFEKKVLQEIEPKKFQGRPVNSTMYLQMVEQLLKAVNQEGGFQVQSSLEYVMEAEQNRVKETLIRQFDNNTAQHLAPHKLPQDTKAIIHFHTQLKSYIHNQLNKKYVNFLDNTVLPSLKSHLDQHMESSLQETLRRNEQLSSNTASSQLYSLMNNFYPVQFQNISQLQNPFIRQKQKEFDSLYQAYLQSTPSQNKYEKICNKIAPLLFDFMETTVHNMKSIFEQENNERQNELVQAKDTVIRLRQSMGEYEQLVGQLKKEKDRIRKQLDETREENTRLEAECMAASVRGRAESVTIQMPDDRVDDVRRKEERVVALEYEVTQLRGINQQLVSKNKLLQQEGQGTMIQGWDGLVPLVEELKYQVSILQEYQEQQVGQDQRQVMEQWQAEKSRLIQKCKDKIAKAERKAEEEQKRLKKKVSILFSSNEELKVELMNLEGRLGQVSRLEEAQRGWIKTEQGLEELVERQSSQIGMQTQVIQANNSTIEKLHEQHHQVEQRLAMVSSEKAYLYSYKDTLNDVFLQSLKYLKRQDNHLNAALRNLNEQDRSQVHQLFGEVGVKL